MQTFTNSDPRNSSAEARKSKNPRKIFLQENINYLRRPKKRPQGNGTSTGAGAYIELNDTIQESIHRSWIKLPSETKPVTRAFSNLTLVPGIAPGPIVSVPTWATYIKGYKVTPLADGDETYQIHVALYVDGNLYEDTMVVADSGELSGQEVTKIAIPVTSSSEVRLSVLYADGDVPSDLDCQIYFSEEKVQKTVRIPYVMGVNRAFTLPSVSNVPTTPEELYDIFVANSSEDLTMSMVTIDLETGGSLVYGANLEELTRYMGYVISLSGAQNFTVTFVGDSTPLGDNVYSLDIELSLALVRNPFNVAVPANRLWDYENISTLSTTVADNIQSQAAGTSSSIIQPTGLVSLIYLAESVNILSGITGLTEASSLQLNPLVGNKVYEDDAAAEAGGVSVGEVYYNTSIPGLAARLA